MTNVLSVVLGLLLGFAVSVFNNFWAYKALAADSKGWAKLLFPLRILICGIAMYVVSANKAMLIGVAAGLLIIKYGILFKTIKDMISERKG